MKCPNCGKELNENTKFCDTCGTPIEGNISENSNNKKSNKLLIIIITSVVVIIGIVIVLVLLLGGKSNGESTDGNGKGGNASDKPVNDVTGKKETPQEKVERQISNLTDEVNCSLQDNYINCVLYITNNNKETVNVVVTEIEFFDEDGNNAGFVHGPLYSNGLGSGKTGYTNFNAYFSKEYKTYKVNYSLQTWFEAEDKSDSVSIKSTDNKQEKRIDVYATNNSDKTIGTVVAYVFYYKNDKLIAVERANVDDPAERGSGGVALIKSGDTVSGFAEYPSGKGYRETLDFDRYEIKIGEAYATISESR